MKLDPAAGPLFLHFLNNLFDDHTNIASGLANAITVATDKSVTMFHLLSSAGLEALLEKW